MRLVVVGVVVLSGCSLNESTPDLDDRDEPDAQPVDTLSVEINCPDVVDLLACLPFDGTTTDLARSHDIDVVAGETTFIPGAAQSALQLAAEVIAPFEQAADFEVASATIEFWLGPSPAPASSSTTTSGSRCASRTTPRCAASPRRRRAIARPARC